MKKDFHLPMQAVVFSCASCNQKHTIHSTLTKKELVVDICSGCHPFYTGNFTGQQVKGRVEKFNKKVVDPATASQAKPKKERVKKKQPNAITSFKELEEL